MKRSQPEFRVTGDGSHTLYLKEMGEYYHSTHGAIRESEYVFIEKGLKACESSSLDLLEVGFGTGLNALLTLKHAREEGLTIRYDALELYPLPPEVFMKLNYTSWLDQEAGGWFEKLHRTAFNQVTEITPFFHLHKMQQDFISFDPNRFYDLVYFDAFAPGKQPEMWSSRPLTNLFQALKPSGVLVTYCAQGKFKRLLKEIGYEVESLTGPPGKREMTRAIRPA
ncbi:MAG TPA: tRNA (5-methylaminomethyl-2-thiouridine)(34)-methyltransferase MnmD [Bacteroidales bacterium]|nr:tRNA (5-methylaminomethyl-2-thiouridine)(34)-methyltransferase MnmD [Bacteroidales bacterium]